MKKTIHFGCYNSLKVTAIVDIKLAHPHPSFNPCKTIHKTLNILTWRRTLAVNLRGNSDILGKIKNESKWHLELHQKTWGWMGKFGDTWGLLGVSWGNMGKLRVSLGHRKLPKAFLGLRTPWLNMGFHGGWDILEVRLLDSSKIYIVFMMFSRLFKVISR